MSHAKNVAIQLSIAALNAGYALAFSSTYPGLHWFVAGLTVGFAITSMSAEHEALAYRLP